MTPEPATSSFASQVCALEAVLMRVAFEQDPRPAPHELALALHNALSGTLASMVKFKHCPLPVMLEQLDEMHAVLRSNVINAAGGLH